MLLNIGIKITTYLLCVYLCGINFKIIVMKKILFLLAMLPMMCYSQDAKDEHKSKIDVFMSEIGIKTKFIDYELKNLTGNAGYTIYKAETCIRKVIKGDEIKYFYRIEPKKDGVDNPVAFIEYSDLKKIKEALESIKSEVEKDLSLEPDYLENKFVTDDYFYIGYYIKKKKITWFIILDKFGTNKHVYFQEVEPLEQAIDNALIKIEELQKQ